MSLIASRRYLLADGVEGWSRPTQSGRDRGARACRPRPRSRWSPHGKAPSGAGQGGRGGRRRGATFAAPGRATCRSSWSPRRRQRGFGLEPAAARLLVERLGPGRCGSRTSSSGWRSGRATAGRSTSPTSRRWSPTPPRRRSGRSPTRSSPATRPRRCEPPSGSSPRARRCRRSSTRSRPRLREALAAATSSRRAGRRGGRKGLSMHPYAAKMLVSKVRGPLAGGPRASICAIADLEWWTRGGSDYPDDVALTLALRRAVGRRAGDTEPLAVGPAVECPGAGRLRGGAGEARRRGTSCGRRCCVQGALLDRLVDPRDQRLCSAAIVAASPDSTAPRAAGNGSSRRSEGAGSRAARARSARSASSVRRCWP